jgi:hypothetical protein
MPKITMTMPPMKFQGHQSRRLGVALVVRGVLAARLRAGALPPVTGLLLVRLGFLAAPGAAFLGGICVLISHYYT